MKRIDVAASRSGRPGLPGGRGALVDLVVGPRSKDAYTVRRPHP